MSDSLKLIVVTPLLLFFISISCFLFIQTYQMTRENLDIKCLYDKLANTANDITNLTGLCYNVSFVKIEKFEIDGCKI